MRKLSRILIMLVAFFLVFGSLNVNAIEPEDCEQIGVLSPSEIDIKEPEPDVYWYFIRMRIDTKQRSIEITGNGGKITRGSLKGFSKAVWWGIAHRQVAIGPFESEEEALNSKIYYKKSKEKITELPQANAPSELHWFEVTFKELKRMNSYEYTHSPAAVSSGSANDFTDALYEGLSFQRLSVGPFWQYEQAEKAKSIYRLNE